MELSPADPSYLDMRNAILQADTASNGGAASNKIWQVFANRGMGYFAGAIDGDDTSAGRGLLAAARADRAEGLRHRHA